MDQKLSSVAYRALCTEFYELDKPEPSTEALAYFLELAAEAKGAILEPMCGSGRFLIPLLQRGYHVTGFDSSPHMLAACLKKGQKAGITCKLLEASFANFLSNEIYQLIFIPSGSFCLLVDKEQVHQALDVLVKCLGKGGKLVLEIDTTQSVAASQGMWKGRWIDKFDGSKLVLNTLSRFDMKSKIDHILCRYEQWRENAIVNTEVECLSVRLYNMGEMDELLTQHGLKVVNKWLPYTKIKPDATAASVLFECISGM